jgi:coproporphyrinogen III oxidase-like Fe-S oxidoreductase
MLGLRLAEGVDLEQLERELGVAVRTERRKRAIERWQQRGALSVSGQRVCLTPSHFVFADAVIRDVA